MRNIVYRPRAVVDLDGIMVYLAFELKSPQAAQAAWDMIRESVERIANVPTIGHAFEDDDLEQGYRRILSGNYWIYYTFDEKDLTVWRIFHASRNDDAYGFHVFG